MEWLKWLNANGPAVQAVAAAIVAVLTSFLVLATIKYVALTRQMAEAAESNIEETRKTFQATHRPFVAIDVSFGPTDNPHFLGYECKAENNGSDEALDLQVEFGNTDDLYHLLITFGDLPPMQRRTVTGMKEFSGALARTWFGELSESPTIKLKYERRFNSRDGRTWKEQGCIVHNPSPEFLNWIEERFKHQS